MRRRLFVIGLDAATLDLMAPWMEEGLLPHLKQLKEQGACGELRSSTPPLSPPAWSSFITGKNPGKHGIFDFVVHKPASYELLYTNGGMIREPSLWKLLSQAGKKVAVVNVPMTYPPEEVNGVLIAGFDSPGADSNFIYPPTIRDELEKALGPFMLRDYPQNHDPDSYRDHVATLLDFHRRLTLLLMRRLDWDFFVVVYSALDLVQHGYWQYMDPDFPGISPDDRARFGNVIKDFYVRVDGIVGELLDGLSEETSIVILSDHGAGPCYKAVFTNKWLESIGLLKYASTAGSGQSWKSTGRRTVLRGLKQLHQAIKKKVPPQGLEWLKRTFPRLREQVKSRIVFSEIDWTQTRAYSFGREWTSIYINLKGKYPCGIVGPGDEYEALMDFIHHELEKLRDPDTGEAVVERVQRAEEVYHGAHLKSAPDLIVTWRNHQYTSWPGYDDSKRSIFESSLKHSDFSDWSRLQKGGNHRPNGVLFLKGDRVRKNINIEGARITDVAPTILYMMGVPVPGDMDGRILKAVMEHSFLCENPPEYVESGGELPGSPYVYSDEEASQIQERLQSLGYVE